MAEQPQEGVYGFQEDPPRQPESEPPVLSWQPESEPPVVSQPRKRRTPLPVESPPARPAKASTMRPIHWVILGVCLAAVAVFVAFMAIRQNRERSEELASFQPFLSELLFTPTKPAPGGSPPRLGKVVLIDVQKRAVDPLHPSVPDDLRARTPAEATTVAQIHYTREQVGQFEMGARAIHLHCTITVADRASHTLLASRSFDWGPPPKSISRGGDRSDVTGPAPLNEITSFLNGLR